MLAVRDYVARRWCGLCEWVGMVDVRVWQDRAHTWVCPGCGMESEDFPEGQGEERWWDRP